MNLTTRLELVPVPTIDFITVDGISIKQMLLPDPGMVIEQHSHDHDHATLLAAGSVRTWTGSKRPVDYDSPAMIEIPARTQHSFQSLEPDTVLYCIHNAERLLADGGDE